MPTCRECGADIPSPVGNRQRGFCDNDCRNAFHGALRSRRLMLLHELVHRMDRDVRQAREIIDELKPQKERNDEKKTEEA